MDTTYAGPATQVMGQSHFFYYNPDPSAENRQHGHFSPHPHGHAYAANVGPGTIHAPMAPYPSELAYSHPPPSNSQAVYAKRAPSYGNQSMLTPIVSPRPLYHKPTVLSHQDSPYLVSLDTDCSDLRFAPSTPPLSSSSGSAVSSPPSSCDLLPTPVNGPSCLLQDEFDIDGKHCEDEAFSEHLGRRRLESLDIAAGDAW